MPALAVSPPLVLPACRNLVPVLAVACLVPLAWPTPAGMACRLFTLAVAPPVLFNRRGDRQRLGGGSEPRLGRVRLQRRRA